MIRRDMPIQSQQQPLGERTSQAAQKAQLKKELSQVKMMGAATMLGGGAAALAMTNPASTPIVAGMMAGGVGAALAMGQLNLPGNQVYEIKPDDTLWDIAEAQLGENASVQEIKAFVGELQQLNSDIIPNQDKIFAGDKIAIPTAEKGSAKEVVSMFDDLEFEDGDSQISLNNGSTKITTDESGSMTSMKVTAESAKIMSSDGQVLLKDVEIEGVSNNFTIDGSPVNFKAKIDN